MAKLEEVETPLSANERFLYAMIQRQDVMIAQIGSIIDYIASKDNVAVTQETRTVVKEEVKEEPKPVAKRTAQRKQAKE